MSETNSRRFAISTLSKSKINEAYNGELIGDKETGEVLFKTPDGDVISYMANSRKMHNIDMLVDAMKACGHDMISIYEAETETIFPTLINAMEMFQLQMLPPDDNPITFTSYSILIDVECLEKNISGLTNKELDAEIDLEVTDIPKDSDLDIFIHLYDTNMSTLKYRVFSTEYLAKGLGLRFTIKNPKLYLDTKSRMILHSILIAVDGISYGERIGDFKKIYSSKPTQKMKMLEPSIIDRLYEFTFGIAKPKRYEYNSDNPIEYTKGDMVYLYTEGILTYYKASKNTTEKITESSIDWEKVRVGITGGTDIGSAIIVSDEQPSTEDTKLWYDVVSEEEVDIPDDL